MKKMFLTMITLMASGLSLAQEKDLTLPAEKWGSAFKNYNCTAFGAEIPGPRLHQEKQVQFERLTTDASLDNGLLKATFVEDGVTCRYSALFFADNAAATMRLVDSKAYAPEEGSKCLQGKAMLDAQFASNQYLYWGHPHNLTVLIPVQAEEDVCGSGFVGVNFVVTGRIK
jgi:hypothetical protein